MRVAGVLHIFQFETRQGEDICMALQTHINDIMMKRYSKVCLCGLQGWRWCLSVTSPAGAVCCGVGGGRSSHHTRRKLRPTARARADRASDNAQGQTRPAVLQAACTD